jgi:type I restriction enzyme S subunit
MSNNNKNKLIPRLRFPEFQNETWERKTIDEICQILNNLRKPLSSNLRERGEYPYYGASGIIDFVKDFIFNERLLLIGEDGAKWGAYEKTAFIAEGKYWVNNHAHVLKPIGVVDTLIENYLVKLDLSPFITGAAPPKLTLGKLKSIPVPIPNSREEQQKIASCLSSLDEVIAGERQKLALLQQHKKGLLQQLFPQEGETVPTLRFKEFEDSGQWEVKKLGEILDYERPDKYIVKDENYTNEGTPVLTANKSFILGYTQETDDICNDIPAIIFDDFTVDKKFVDFPFKVKSSAIKILRPKGKDDLKFIFELMTLISFEAKEHKRYYISTFQNLTVPIPKLAEQQKIASCLSSLDDIITAQTEKIELLEQHKKGMVQGLFPMENE